MSAQEFVGQAAEYRPVDGDELVPGTIVEIRTVTGPDGENRRVVLDVGDGELVDTDLDRVDLI